MSQISSSISPLLNVLEAQTSILPSFPKTLVSRCRVECMELSYLSQPCIPCQLPLLSHGEQRIVESHLDGSSSSLLRRILLARDANPFHTHAITFRFENELRVVPSSLSSSSSSRLRHEAHFHATIALGNCANVKSVRVVIYHTDGILHRALDRLQDRHANIKP